MRTRNVALILALGAFLMACSKESDRSSFPKKDFVTIYYCAGYNNLSSSIQGNLKTMKSADLPFSTSKHILLTFTHFSLSDSNFEDLTESHLVRLSKDFGKLTADTLYTIDRTRYATDPDVLTEVLKKVKELYPNADYGMIVSSHGTGWLPAGKYNNSNNYLQFSKGKKQQQGMPLYRYNDDPDQPKVKTFGAEVELRNDTKYSRELTIQSMAEAIPIHLDYLIFDACLMGGVEVAYEFKDVADVISFSPTEVLADGFDYTTITHLLQDEPDVIGFSKAYFERYNSQSGSNQSATITVVDTDKIDELAAVCKELFIKYRSGIAALNTRSGVQAYFRSNYHWFYDLEDVLSKAGMSDEDKAMLENALSQCISYKAATPSFLGIEINNFSGLSMYLPGAGDSELNDFYHSIAWNDATNLVE